MEGFSGVCRWVAMISDEWLCPHSPVLWICPSSPVPKDKYESHTISIVGMVAEDLGTSLSPLHASREIIAGYKDCTLSSKLNKNRKLSYSSLPLAADEMD
jgi:rubredoxin